jgi:hypothetical protein
MKDIGGMTLYKGKLGDVQLIMWDALPDCSDACPIFDECPYDKKRMKCEMRRRYLESVMASLEAGVTKKDEMSALTIGLMVAPLFQSLISFKIFEHSLGHDVMLRTKIHPIYKEIRQTIKEISSLLKDLGITEDGKNKSYLDGNSEYYDEMIKNGRTVS